MKKFISLLLALLCSFAFIIPAFAVDNNASVIGFLVAPSQYTNNPTFGAGIQNTVNGNKSIVSLGNFGGYATYMFEKPIYDSPTNPFGIDFIINGNAFAGHAGAAEPGQVWVSQDGENWFAIAGSEHYENSTIWDYSVTYTKTDNPNICAFADSLGDSGLVSSKTTSKYPLAENYPLASIHDNGITLSGVLIKKERTPSTAATVETQFGYVDAKSAADTDIASNPYLENPSTNCKDGQFDIALAVNEDGLPVNLPWIKYIKVQTATFIDSDVFGEKSTEIGSVKIAQSTQNNIGTTPVASIEVNGQELDIESTHIFTIPTPVGDSLKISVKANNANVYVNNQYCKEETLVKANEKGLIRILVQSENFAPSVYYINTSSADKYTGLFLKNLTLEKNSVYTIPHFGNFSACYCEDENVAIVSRNGTVKCNEIGSTYICIKAQDGTLQKCKLTVVSDGKEEQIDADVCSCNCHKTGFMSFIWKIQRFFFKLFKINPVCKCGATHY